MNKGLEVISVPLALCRDSLTLAVMLKRNRFEFVVYTFNAYLCEKNQRL
jgi:hypothetical protein